jgi:hypothetical protein
MRECLVWLDTPQHKGKRQIRRPLAIPSGKYQEGIFPRLQKKRENKYTEESCEGNQERNMTIQNIWLKRNIIKK